MQTSVSRRVPLLAAAISLTISTSTLAQPWQHKDYFERIATFPVYQNLDLNNGDHLEDTTSSEIIAATLDGMALVYTDSPKHRVGFIDITDAAQPKPAGFLQLDGEPTSVGVVGHYALVAVNTSVSFTQPSGRLAVVDIQDIRHPLEVASITLGGQPDSVAISPDGQFAAIAVENERDEDVNDGLLPQLPAGYLSIVDLQGAPSQWQARFVDLTGLADIAPEDPEPEFVSIGDLNIAAVTLQENNHIALVDLRSGRVIKHFSAGTVDLQGVDTVEDDVINPVDNLFGKRREPDAIAWVGPFLATANEGDYQDANGDEGGSRGFSLFSPFGPVVYDSGTQLEYTIMRAGHYPESRSENKGIEPEGVTYARFGKDNLLFVGSERANVVAVYQVSPFTGIRLQQLLPTGIGPEGLVAIPQRNLFVAAAENDSAEDGFRSTVSIYRRDAAKPSYPEIQSDPQQLIPWGALSGLAADRWNPYTLYAVPDSYYKQSRIFTIDARKQPALIREATVLSKDGDTVNYDLEGIAQRADGGFWLASEGDGKNRPNLLIRADAQGVVQAEYALPAATAAKQKSNGFEGVAVVGSGASERVYVAFQREWKDDPAGQVRIGVFNPNNGRWAYAYYPLDAAPEGAWVGLSELTYVGHGEFLVIERDNQQGPKAEVKKLYRISLKDVTPVAEGGSFPLLSKTLEQDLLPALQSSHGWVLDKVEGAAVSRNGQLYVVTDNDGVDDASGETRFLRLGPIHH